MWAKFDPAVLATPEAFARVSVGIAQTNPDAPVVLVERAVGVRLRDVTLTRTAGQDANASALVAEGCADLTVQGVRVLDNRAPAGAIRLNRCDGARVIHCLVRNYSRVAVDDRTANADLGYAFRCIDGTGIEVAYSKGVLIQGNRVVERVMVPTRVLRERHAPGQFVKKNAVRGTLIGQEAWDAGYVGELAPRLGDLRRRACKHRDRHPFPDRNPYSP